MSFNTDIHNALRAQLITVSGMPTGDLIFGENDEEKGSVNSRWVRTKYLPESEQLVASGMIRGIGQFQISVFEPKGEGYLSVDAFVDTIVQAFDPDTTLASLVRVYRSERLPGIEEDKWYQVPILVYWRAERFI